MEEDSARSEYTAGHQQSRKPQEDRPVDAGWRVASLRQYLQRRTDSNRSDCESPSMARSHHGRWRCAAVRHHQAAARFLGCESDGKPHLPRSRHPLELLVVMDGVGQPEALQRKIPTWISAPSI